MAHLDEQPVHAAPPDSLGLAVEQQAADDVGALRLQVRVDGIRAAPEVQALREKELRLVLQQA